MAIDLTVHLTDAEQALVQELAVKVAPGATAPQIIAWATQQCKAGLRQAVIEKWAEYAREEANALVVSQLDRSATDFPEVT